MDFKCCEAQFFQHTPLQRGGSSARPSSFDQRVSVPQPFGKVTSYREVPYSISQGCIKIVIFDLKDQDIKIDLDLIHDLDHIIDLLN